MFDSKDYEESHLRNDSHRLIGSEHSARYLRSLPEFQVESELPANLRLLLQSLEQAEKNAPRRT